MAQEKDKFFKMLFQHKFGYKSKKKIKRVDFIIC